VLEEREKRRSLKFASGNDGARQFILGVSLKFFWRPKNFLHPKNLVIYTIYASQNISIKVLKYMLKLIY
jgi:hypothetical protein